MSPRLRLSLNRIARKFSRTCDIVLRINFNLEKLLSPLATAVTGSVRYSKQAVSLESWMMIVNGLQEDILSIL